MFSLWTRITERNPVMNWIRRASAPIPGNETHSANVTREAAAMELGSISNVAQRESAESGAWAWEINPTNPYNWSDRKKRFQLLTISFVAFTASLGTSIISPAHDSLMKEFGVSVTAAFLPISTYVWALGLGPIVGGPLSETAGRQAVWCSSIVLGGLCSAACGLVHNFGALCFLRFLAGFFYGPSLAIGAGVLSEVYVPAERGLPASVYILSPFLGPGLGPVVGVYLTIHAGWRWTQYTLAICSALGSVFVFYASETFHAKIQRRVLPTMGLDAPQRPENMALIKEFATITVLRPLKMLFTDPIVGLLSLYVSFVFGILFIFFGAFFWVFAQNYHFTLEQSGLVFLAIVLGCIIGTIVVSLCTRFIYMPMTTRFPRHETPPEWRLFPAWIGSILLPVSLFWFACTADGSHPAAVPITAIVFFGTGNICLFVSALQYMGDTFHRTTVASAASANSFARYTMAAVFPLFSIQMYEALGVKWATMTLGFISLAMLPLPFALVWFGERLRQRSRFETAAY